MLMINWQQDIVSSNSICSHTHNGLNKSDNPEARMITDKTGLHLFLFLLLIYNFWARLKHRHDEKHTIVISIFNL